MLLGRESERQRIGRLLDSVQRGQSDVLVLSGEAGIGKTALLRYAVDRAGSMTVVRATGIESEAELEFSGLLQLCRPVIGVLDEIPEHQAATLRAALGLSPSTDRDRFAVGAATLSLLAAAGERNPVLVVVDDAQWLDAASADALRFAARRLDRDRVGFLFAVRQTDAPGREPHGFETAHVGGLDLDDARALLAGTAAGHTVPDEVAARLHAATHGNPLALVELPALLSAEQLAGLAPVEDPLPAGRSVEAAYSLRVKHLPADSRRALVLVAAATEGRVELIGSGLSRLGLDAAALQPAEDERLIAVEDGTVRFRHPLVRSAVYQSAPAAERRAAHAGMADAFQAVGDVDRSTRHLAAAAVGPDEDVAGKLAVAGARSRERSAYASAADAFELAARLTPDRMTRGERLADAAEAAWAGGAAARAFGLVAEALDASNDPRLCARVQLLRGRIELQSGRQPEARAQLQKAATLIEGEDPKGAAGALTYVVFSSHFEGRIAEALAVARRARALVPHDGGADDLRLDYVLGRSLLLAGQIADGVPLVERMVAAALDTADPPRPRLAAAAIVLSVLDRHRECRQLVERVLGLARAEGPMALAYALSVAAETELRGGRLQRAAAAASEGLSLTRHLGQANIAATFLVVLARTAALRGAEADFEACAGEALALLGTAGMALPIAQVSCSRGLLEFGLGRLDDAAATFADAAEWVETAGVVDRDVAPEPELVEVLARLGRLSAARETLDAWTHRVDIQSIAWASALAARCNGLLADDDTFEREFLEALDLHADAEDLSRARTLLCFGERLRRAGRRRESRERLRAAHAAFDELEARPWADRARRELRASGERLRRAHAFSGEELTPQERQVAFQVAEGKSNKEVAAALFLSPKTVEFHLSRIYRKLDLSSRSELIRRFAAGEPLAVAR